MTQPAVNLTQLDGSLGVQPPSSGEILYVVGVASSGPFNTPSTWGRVTPFLAAFGVGPGVEAAALHLSRGKQVCFIRTSQTTDGAAGTVDSSAKTGTSAVTVTTTTLKPLDDYDVYLIVTTGGTIGTTGIKIKVSLDKGRTLSAEIALATATSYTIPGSGVVLAFAAGTLIAGDIVQVRTSAPKWTAAELLTALTAVSQSVVTWGICEIVGAVDATAFDTIETGFATITGLKKFRMWMASPRIPTVGETEAAYLSSLSTAFASKATIVGSMCAGSMLLTSAVSGRSYERPAVFDAASNEASVSQEIDTADVNLGARPVSITDANGNPLLHDETINPGLDDARFYVYRTWTTRAGVYVNRPRIFSAQGSDFQLVPHRRVMNLALATVNEYFERVLSKPLLVNKKTGFILESEAVRLENGCNNALRAVLGGKASGWTTAISRSDNLLSTSTLTGDVRVIPLAYVENINLNVGFQNPALNLQAA